MRFPSTTPGVTVGLPAFNEESSIASALRSVLEATYHCPVAAEIIVVASGCTDRTANVARNILNGQPHAFVLEGAQRRGKADALNTIAELAQGQILVFSDADVCIHPQALQCLYRTLSEDPSVSVAYARMDTVPGSSLFWSRVGISNAAALDAYRDSSDGSGLWMVCGHLYAIRKGDWHRLPPWIVCDDIYVGLEALAEGRVIRYVREAKVYVRYPQNLKDYLRQKTRNRLGRLQLGEVFQSLNPQPPRWIGLQGLHRWGVRAIRHLPAALLDTLIVAYASVLWKVHRAPPVLWEPIPSTKLDSQKTSGRLFDT